MKRPLRCDAIDFEVLEPRCMLNADFALTGSQLVLDQLTNNESLFITSSETEHAIRLSTGTWAGTDGGGITGSGMDTLIVDRSVLDALAAGLLMDGSTASNDTILFANSDFSNMIGVMEINGFTSVSQISPSPVKIPVLHVTANTLNLQSTDNQISTVKINVDKATIHTSQKLTIQGSNVVARLFVDSAKTIQLATNASLQVSEVASFNSKVDIALATKPGTSFSVDGSAYFSATGAILLGTQGSTNLKRVNFSSGGYFELNEDSSTHFFGTNDARNILVVSAGSITDKAETNISVINRATFIANSAITLANHQDDVLSIGGDATFRSVGSTQVGRNLLGGLGGQANFGGLNFDAGVMATIKEDSGTTLFGSNRAPNAEIESAGMVSDRGLDLDIDFGLSIHASANIQIGGRTTDLLRVGGTAHFQGDTGVVIFKNGVANFGRLNFVSNGFVSISEDSQTYLSGNNTGDGVVINSTGNIADLAGATVNSTGIFNLNAANRIYIADQAGNRYDALGRATLMGTNGVRVNRTGMFKVGQLTFQSAAYVFIQEDNSTFLAGQSSANRFDLESGDYIGNGVGARVTSATVASFTANRGILLMQNAADRLTVCSFALFTAADFVRVKPPGDVTLVSHWVQSAINDVTVDSNSC